ncbi:ABC transporter C family member 9 [Linum grandiflorum]
MAMAWPELPCFPEQLALFVQLCFVAVIFLSCLTKLVRRKNSDDRKQQQAYLDDDDDNNINGEPPPPPTAAAATSCSTLCKASVACSILLTTIHCLILLTTLFLPSSVSGRRSRCDSGALSLSSEGSQLALWLASLIGIYHVIKSKKYVVFPWIVRLWWVSGFLLSGISVSVRAYLRSDEDDMFQLEWNDYADLLAFLLSAFLFCISVNGKTGTSTAAGTNSLQEPLIAKTATDMPKLRSSPYGNASIFQLVTFSWMNELFRDGFRKTLDQDDIPDVDIHDSASFLSSAFTNCLEAASASTTSPSFYRAIFLLVRKKAALNALFAVISACASYVGPYLINGFVDFLSRRKEYSLRTGYMIALGFLCAKMVETVSQRQWIFGARQLGLRLRSALNSQIYSKGLVLSARSRQGHTSGEIINYMSVDVNRVTDFIWYLNIIWMLPIQISLAILILNTNLGAPGSLAALGATMIVMSCNIPVTQIQKWYQGKIMEAKDARMKATSEVLRNMKTIKLQAWDSQFLLKLEGLREVERSWLWKSLRLSATTAFIFWGSPAFISTVTFGACYLMGVQLTAGRVLSALATFRMLQDPIFNLPDLLSTIAQAKVSADRITSYMQEEEIQEDAVELIPPGEEEDQYGVEIKGGTFTWTPESKNSITLSGIDLDVKRGMRVAVCGTVGSGKSSLLSCILGEIHKLSGIVRISGTKVYVAQCPWILTGSIRDNILFGKAYDSEKYRRTVEACALVKDFELFSCGDLTEIGERGINMSGGQKQRIQIARAVYQDADIYLLDDPFSAVDAHTGTHLFQECLMGILKSKTILYVTHQVEFLPAADLIVVMQNGRIVQTGKFDQLVQQNDVGFEALVGAHSDALESVLAVENSTTRIQPVEEEEEEEKENARPEESEHQQQQDQSGKLVQDEEREKGSIGKQVYWAYLTCVKGGVLVPIIILAQSSFQVLQISSNYWMAWATPPTTDISSDPPVGMGTVLLVYTLLAASSSLCVLLRAMLVATVGLSTAEKLFSSMLHSVIRAPMHFFDSTPTGRIMNRASTDQSVLDLEMGQRLGWCAFSIIQILGTIAVMSQVAWEVFVIFIPVTGVCIWYQQYYTPTARELARLSGIQLAPILHHFSESLAGAATIRAFGEGERFIASNLGLIDNYSRPWFHNVSAMEWLSFRLNLLSNFVFAFSLVLLVTLPEGIISPSIAGLAVTYGINLNVLQASVIWNICNAENKMISVERVLQYTKIKGEEPLVIEECRPPANWPETGTICFKDLQIRYAEHLPSVLKNVSCTFPGRRKVGVVGRTGSGKSTLTQALFRMVTVREGSIIIDGVDISKIGLHDLRSRLSIIPQDPTMFEGTVRGNLDPLGHYSDFQVWEALEKCQLGSLVREKDGKLDATVTENGENWSAGQRQLFCLGRALLKKSSILVLDEATASVDSATDSILQKIISEEFKDRTVVTIAHRIHTVIDSDLVLVLSDGRVAEYDSPKMLLQRKDSFFSKLIKEYSARSSNLNSSAS